MKKKNCILKVTEERSRTGVGSISQRCGTNQNGMDPQRWLVGFDKCKPLERFWKLLIKVGTYIPLHSKLE
jgi:hypothetical protein